MSSTKPSDVFFVPQWVVKLVSTAQVKENEWMYSVALEISVQIWKSGGECSAGYLWWELNIYPHSTQLSIMFSCVCVCVSEGEREKEIERIQCWIVRSEIKLVTWLQPGNTDLVSFTSFFLATEQRQLQLLTWSINDNQKPGGTFVSVQFCSLL